jgi:class 3 adenylate cyclase
VRLAVGVPALAIRDRCADLAAGWRKRGYALDAGVGVALGYATLGRIGFEGRSDYAAIGTVTNLAARLCGEAQAGQVLVSQKVHAEVEGLAEAERLPALTLKGFGRPVPAFDRAAAPRGPARHGGRRGLRTPSPAPPATANATSSAASGTVGAPAGATRRERCPSRSDWGA